MKTIFKTILTAILLFAGSAGAGAVDLLRESLEKAQLSNDIASINSWKPELREIPPVSSVVSAGDDTPEYIDDMLSYARTYLGLRYRRGGKTPKGFDCSGFTGYIFRQFGMTLNASSSSQYTQGDKVEEGDLRPGDLVFFGGRAAGKTRVGHVGLVTDVNADGTFRFIHSSTSQGVIVSASTEPYYLRRYIGARRVR